MAKAPPSIAVTSTLEMVRAAATRGADPRAVLQELHVDPATLEDPDARLPGPTVLAIWNALRVATGDPTLHGYEVLRSDGSGGPYTKIALVTGTSYVDTSVGRKRHVLLRRARRRYLVQSIQQLE